MHRLCRSSPLKFTLGFSSGKPTQLRRRPKCLVPSRSNSKRCASICICSCRTYSVSVAIAPLNIATGELCDEVGGKPHWDRIVGFYAASAAFQLAGLAAFIVLAYSGVGGASAFSKKDMQLEKAVVATPRRKRPSDSGWIMPRSSDGRIPGSPVGRPEPEREPQREKELVDPIRQTTEIQRYSLVQIWRRSAFVAATMAISLVQNLLACGLFGRLRIQGDIPVLRTTMLYSFYISQCCGTLLVMVRRNHGFGALVQ